jgi:hypothetical protein
MEFEPVSHTEYALHFPSQDHIFNSVEFNELNKNKCDRLFYLLYHEKKNKIGLIAGAIKDELLSPFSAPHGGFSTNRSDIKLPHFENCVHYLDEFAKKNNIKSIKFILPPYFYNESGLAKTYYALTRNNFVQLYYNVNHHFYYETLNKYTDQSIDRETRRNIRKATDLGLTFKQVFEKELKLSAYAIIKSNKELKGRPLHLSFEQLQEMEHVTPVDYFLVNFGEVLIASAIVYHVSRNIVQFIYWGDLREYAESKPMIFLAYHLFEHYTKNNIKYIDLAISSENGIPNYGLCNFKEDIGCDVSIKHTLYKQL